MDDSSPDAQLAFPSSFSEAGWVDVPKCGGVMLGCGAGWNPKNRFEKLEYVAGSLDGEGADPEARWMGAMGVGW